MKEKEMMKQQEKEKRMMDKGRDREKRQRNNKEG